EGVRVYASDASDHPYGGDALEALRALSGVTLDVGRHDLARIRAAAAVIVSPGVPPEAPPLAAAREAHVPILSEIDLGFRALAGSGTHCIAITGTNGKTTTTALVAHLLRAAGLRAEAAGNIGRPLADIALQDDRYQWLAVEVSSFQLHDSPHFAPVREVGGVRWINDSKATNIASTVVAVEAMDRPFVLLLGGRHKGEPYTRLASLLKSRCRLVIAYGESGELIERDLGGQVPLERGTTFD